MAAVDDQGVVQDEAIMAQQDRIEKEIAESQPLIGDNLNITALGKEYADEDAVYQDKIKDLSSRYKSIRKTRGDGNCFFRAFAFAYLETLLSEREELDRFVEIARKTKDNLVSLGFPAFTIEDFYDTFMDALESVQKGMKLEELLNIFREQSLSDYLVVYLRLITSGQLQKEADFYQNFIEGGMTIKEFCNREVEPMAKESDHIHIIALTTVLDVGVRIEYMDRGEAGGGGVNQHDFPSDCTPKITLLYRPGHYDILYLR